MRDEPFPPSSDPSERGAAVADGFGTPWSDDITQEFWGTGDAWSPRHRPTRTRSDRSNPERPGRFATTPRTGLAADVAGLLRAVRDGIAAFHPQTVDPSTRPGRSRQHGPPGDPARDVPRVPVEQHAVTDPVLRRAGLATLLTIVLVPLALAARPDAEAPVTEFVQALPAVTTPATVTLAAAPEAAPAPAPVPGPVDTDVAAQAPVAAAPEPAPTGDDPSTGVAADESEVDDEEAVEEWTRTESASTGAAAGVNDGAETDEPAARVGRDCDQHYTAGPGDSWYRIADAAGISPDELLAANNATVDTVLYPGDRVCLPADATMPSPPPTTSTPPSTTDAPVPTTTDAPADDDPVEQLGPSEVQDLIRATWPADQVDKALAVAWRESNYIATADNGWCCVGVFQIYWTVHQGWLDDFGIDERDDLKDARKNIAAAHALWQRAGWGPWGG